MNTGKKIYTTLIEVDSLTRIPTGQSKPNIIEDPDYIAPITDYVTCPIETITTTTTTTTTLIGKQFICNLANSVSCSPAMCATGNEYMTLLYANSSSIVPGTQLYYDEALTQPVLNQTWVRDTDTTTIYALNSSGIVLEGLLTCPIA